MEKIIEVTCPKCKSSLWIDIENKEVVQHKKGAKQLSSFEDLLEKEKKKKESTEETFTSAKELEKAKKKKAEDFFNKSFKE
ncbi:MAG: hypothetical protein KAR14_01390 [Candidatus Aminicenantes bacterium]|nr:hypothetical protein [Candidatus Aminicenantes bacterium]